MLAAEAVSVVRGGRRILDEVTLALHPGEVLGLLGPNGAGKSTLIKVLTGEFAADAGQATLDGKAVTAWPAPQLALRRAVLPQQSRLVFGLSVLEVVALGRSVHAGRPSQHEDEGAVAAGLAASDMVRFAGRDYRKLSGGEQQRVQFARVLAQLWSQEGEEERYLLLDEPVASLDLAHQQTILQAARAAARSRGFGVLASLHDPNLAAAYADRIAILSDGRLAAEGTPEAVLTPSVLERVFGLPMLALKHPDSTRPVLVPAYQAQT